jgi:imidazolonepropionase-like amidohydrolase
MAVASPLAIKFALGENPKMSYGNKAQSPVTRMATAAIIREQLAKAKRSMRDVELASSDKEDDSEPDLPDYDIRLEALLPLLRREIRAHFHAHKAYDILSAVRIAEEFGLDYTLIHCTEGYLVADILAGLNARAVCGPLLMTRTKPELANMAAENCARLHEAGVLTAISTDYPEAPIGFLAASASLAVVGGMERQAALEAITISAAKAVGLEARIGSISPGKDADLLVFSQDPLTLGAKPDIVIIDGEIVG